MNQMIETNTIEKLEVLVKNIPVGAAYVVNEMVCFNKEVENITGYSNNEIKTVKQWFGMLVPDDCENKYAEYKADREKGFLSRILRIKTRRGDIRQLEMAGYMSQDVEIWLIYDALARRASENSLWLNYERFRTVADYSLDWEYWCMPDGKYAYVSPVFQEITGYSVSELLEDADFIFKIALHEDKHLILHHWNNRMNSDSCMFEFRIISKSGAIKHIEHRCRKVYSPDGSWLGIKGSNKDITDRKRIEKELEAERDRAAAANAAKSLFLAKMSHEIRTPMNAVVGFASILQKTMLDEEQLDYLNNILSSSQKLLSVVNEILDISRIEAGKFEINNAPFNFAEMVSECVESLNVMSLSRGLYIEQEIDERLNRAMIGDEIRIRQIIINLVSNAIKYTMIGGVKITMKLDNEVEGKSKITIVVADTGIGIPPEDLERIFEKYVQSDSEKRLKSSGAGLGLAIVKNLLDLMGGTITVKSEYGKGSEFTAKICLDDALPVDNESAIIKSNEINGSAPVGVEASINDNRKIKLLIVDDEPSNRKLLAKMLSYKGWESEIATSGTQAIEMAAAEDHDAILMDIQMPDMDGLSAFKLIRKKLETAGRIVPPIIAVTANVMANEIEEYTNAGMHGFIPKPINIEQLHDMISGIIEHTV